MKPYTVRIQETYERTVIVCADDEAQAEEKAHDLCAEDVIEIDAGYFVSRKCEALREANDFDVRDYILFGESQDDERLHFVWRKSNDVEQEE